MRVWLLGGFRVSVGERTVGEGEWGLRKARSLVKLLALARRHRLHRDQVLDLLWPELSRSAATNNLHRTLHAARRALGPGASHYLRLRGEQLALCPEAELRVDVGAFEEAAAAARGSRDPGTCRAAAELYAGDLLPQDLYEEWTEPRREVLKGAYLALLLELAAAHEERGEPEAAAEALLRAITARPTHEEANLRLMRLYALRGWRQEVLRHYERFQEALGEAGATPAAAARRLREEALAGRLPPDGSAVGGEVPSAGPKPPKTGPHNLPGALTSFVGRERELVEVRRELAMSRLLTLTGAGGSGKTRLALEAAGGLTGLYGDGVWLVELAPLAEGELVAQEISRVLDVPEKPDLPLAEALAEYLSSRRLLLVLDNCEHLIEPVARLAESLLLRCPGLRILATSREALGVAGEVRHPVPTLALPDPDRSSTVEELKRTESAWLFVERASRRGSTFTLTPRNAGPVARICRQLDGMPLAIELVAARVGSLSVEQISVRLDGSLALLSGNRPAAHHRHRTLEGTLDWGHELLPGAERRLFGRLSVFAGGFSLEAAEAVGSGGDLREGDVLDLLLRLVDKSLVVAEASPEAEDAQRFRMLEPVRQYAHGKLEACGEADAVRERHAAFFLALARRAESELKGPAQEIWLRRLEAEHDNLRTALRHALGRGSPEAGLALAGTLGEFWTIRGRLDEGRGWIEAALKSAGTSARSDASLHKVLLCGSNLTREKGDYARAEALGERSLKLARELDDGEILAGTLYDLGLLSLFQSHYERAASRLGEALILQHESGNSVGAALTLQALGLMATARGDYGRAEELHEEALALAHRTKDPVATVFALGSGALVAVRRGEPDRARRLHAEGLGLLRRLGYERMLVHYLHIAAVISVAEGRLVRAARLWSAAQALRESIGAALSPVEERYFAPYVAAVREGLDEPTRKAAQTEGRAMTREQATDYALLEDEPLAEETSGRAKPASLSPREREVANLVAEGLTNRRIAEALGITKRTADTHVSAVLRKLRLDSRRQVGAWLKNGPSHKDQPAGRSSSEA